MKIENSDAVKQIIAEIKNCNSSVKVSGSWGSFAPLLAVNIQQATKRPVLYITAYLDDADKAADDIGTFGNKNTETFCGWAGEELVDATDEISRLRARVGLKIAAGKQPKIITASIQALSQPVVMPDVLLENGLSLKVGQSIDMRDITDWLAERGFEPVTQVDMPGQFAKRGGIIDIFAPLTADADKPQAIRIEFFGDDIESIREINLDNQLSQGDIKKITIASSLGQIDRCKKTQFINLLSKDTIVFIDEPTGVQETAELFLSRVEKPEKLYTFSEIYGLLKKFQKISVCRFADDSESIELKIRSIANIEHKSSALLSGYRKSLATLAGEAENGSDVYLYCENFAQQQRIREILLEDKIKTNKNFHLPVGIVHQGFAIEEDGRKIIVATHHEIFGQSIVRRAAKAAGAGVSIDSFAQLSKGDYVVHLSYGIGKFKGTELIEKNGSKCEFLTLEYADKVIIHVSAQNIALVQKYIGTTAARPPLSKIGTKKWENQKKLVATATAELAAELLETQAKRQAVKGIAYPADSGLFREFEQSFAYQETPDQITAMGQIKADMQRTVPMDRLLCGDVGYGKTELAIRAAFKTVEAGKQVAVLVPTTVLCVQHERTFVQRFADFPVCAESLNRFKTAKQAKNIIERTKQKKVDILIGTHRILSRDVGFADLGLLIIDEEQRFGVEHKEKLKRLKVNIDVLTMTATPIPRTLHMALLGLRDISSLSTAPMDRRAVATHVKKFNDDIIKKAVQLEMNRQGQVFFLHNRVQSMERFERELKKIVPDARIAIAHGQMHKHDLETAMLKFVLGQIDILLCSTIIESGIDIPNANTIIVNEADRFGLAQLHQLRGRVGRFKHKAYAYFLLPKSRTVAPVAVKRLKAIEEFSQLGSGFKIALRDLEIRGAGNILGPEQSGHINTVGYDLFCRLLADAVKRLKNEPISQEATTVVDVGFSAYIPKNYIPAESQRLDVYRKIAAAKTTQDINAVSEQLNDMFGKIVDDVQMLLDIAEIRTKAAGYGIRAINADKNDLIFTFEQQAGKKINDIFAKAPGKVSIPDGRTVYVRLAKQYFEPRTLLAVLRKILSKKK